MGGRTILFARCRLGALARSGMMAKLWLNGVCTQMDGRHLRIVRVVVTRQEDVMVMDGIVCDGLMMIRGV